MYRAVYYYCITYMHFMLFEMYDSVLSAIYIYMNGEIIINSANMYLINLLPKRFRLSASSEV